MSATKSYKTRVAILRFIDGPLAGTEMCGPFALLSAVATGYRDMGLCYFTHV